ncbi:MAG: histidine phosphatase family protein [Desulfobacterales bacterium]
MTTAETTRFGLIRHAETLWNCEKRIQGHLDSVLTTAGRRQAEAWGRLLKTCRWDRCICSDLARARTTAAIINRVLEVPIASEAGLREQSWGSWSGRTLAHIMAEVPQRLKGLAAHGWRFCPPGGEDRIGVWERGQRALTEAARKWPGTTILVVTHEGLIKCLVYRLLQRRFLPTEPPILKPAHLHWLVCRRGKIDIEEINAIDLAASVPDDEGEDNRAPGALGRP